MLPYPDSLNALAKSFVHKALVANPNPSPPYVFGSRKETSSDHTSCLSLKDGGGLWKDDAIRADIEIGNRGFWTMDGQFRSATHSLLPPHYSPFFLLSSSLIFPPQTLQFILQIKISKNPAVRSLAFPRR